MSKEVKKVETIIQNSDPYADLKGIPVSCAHLHQAFAVPGCAVQTTLQTSEANISTKTRGIKMKYTSLGLACEIAAKQKGLKVPSETQIFYFMIPHANLVGVIN